MPWERQCGRTPNFVKCKRLRQILWLFSKLSQAQALISTRIRPLFIIFLICLCLTKNMTFIFLSLWKMACGTSTIMSSHCVSVNRTELMGLWIWLVRDSGFVFLSVSCRYTFLLLIWTVPRLLWITPTLFITKHALLYVRSFLCVCVITFNYRFLQLVAHSIYYAVYYILLQKNSNL